MARFARRSTREPVNKAIDWVINLAVKGVKAAGKFVKGLVGKKEEKPKAQPDAAPVAPSGIADKEVTRPLSLTGEGHTLKIAVHGGHAQILMASMRFMGLRGLLENAMKDVREDPGLTGEEREGILGVLEKAWKESDGDEILSDFFNASKDDPVLSKSQNQDHYFEKRLDMIVAKLEILREFKIKSLEDFHKRRGRDHGPYSHLPEFSGRVEPGRDFTASQRGIIIGANRTRCGGVVRSDLSNTVLNQPPGPGQPYDPLAWHVDHIIPQSRGGANSVTNAQVLSAEENLAKGART